MADLDKLAGQLDDPKFAQAYEQDHVKAVENVIGRPLSPEEQEGLKTLHLHQLKKVVHALKPSTAQVMRPD